MNPSIVRVVRSAAVALAAAWVSTSAQALPASADPELVSVPISAQGWAWIAAPGGGPGALAGGGVPGGSSPVPSGIAAGQLPVSAVVGSAEKISYVAFRPSSPVRTLGLVAPIDPTGSNAMATTARIQACRVLEAWSAENPMPWQARPRTDCTASAPGIYSEASGTYSFDLTAMLPALASTPNFGVSLEPVLPADGAFQVVFAGSGPNGLRLTGTAEPGVSAIAGLDPPNNPAPPNDPVTPGRERPAIGTGDGMMPAPALSALPAPVEPSEGALPTPTADPVPAVASVVAPGGGSPTLSRRLPFTRVFFVGAIPAAGFSLIAVADALSRRGVPYILRRR